MDDIKYEDLLKSERKADKNKKKFNYKIQSIKCCAVCQNSSRCTIEDSLECSVINPDSDYNVSNTHAHGICDMFKESEK